MARTTINSLGIPADTIVSADLDYPLTDFSSTGIDDNAVSTAITIDSSQDVTFTSDAKFPDNGKAIFGAGSDLQLYHDGTNSFATTTTGQLFLSSAASNVWMRALEGGILNTDGTEYLIRATSNGSVKLFYDNVKKFETTSTGIDVTGTVTADGLNVEAASAPTISLEDNDNGFAASTISATNGGRDFTFNTPQDYFFNQGGSTAFTILSGGNVGIGTTSPANKLDVLGDTYSAAFYRDVDVTQVGPAGSFIQIGARSGSSRVPGAAFGSLLDNPATTGDAIIQTRTAGALTEKMRIDTSGNVGIGTTSPDAPLHIQTASGSKSEINLAQTAVTNFRISIPASTDALTFVYGASTERMRIDSNGTLGLGVIPATDWGDDGIQIGSKGTLSGGSSYTGYAFNAYPTSSGWASKYTTTDEASLYLQGAGLHIWYNAASGTAGTAVPWQERMRITDIGNVGIGTTNPSLSGIQSGSTALTISATSSNRNGFFELNGTRTASGNVVSYIRTFNNAGATPLTDIRSYRGASDTTGELAFFTSDVERMRINSSGYVGIGTNIPDANLHIYNSGQPPVSDSLYANMILDTNSAANYQRIRFDVGTTPYWGLTREGVTANFLLSGRIGSTWSDTVLVAEQTTGNIGINTATPSAVISSGRILQIASSGNTTLSVRSTDSVNDRSAILELLSTGNGGSKSIILFGDTDTTPGTPSPLVFQSYHSGVRTERMRIDTSGSVLIGTTTASPGLFRVHQTASNFVSAYFNSVSSSTTEYGIIINLQNDPNDTTRYLMVGRGATNTDRFKVFSNGNVVNQNNSYGSISDEKLKENITDSGSQWEDIKALRVRKYSMKADALDAPNKLGVIAQEVEAAGMSGLVINSPDLDENNNDLGSITKSINYSILYMKAVKALQEAMDRIETLEAEVATLKGA